MLVARMPYLISFLPLADVHFVKPGLGCKRRINVQCDLCIERTTNELHASPFFRSTVSHKSLASHHAPEQAPGTEVTLNPEERFMRVPTMFIRLGGMQTRRNAQCSSCSLFYDKALRSWCERLDRSNAPQSVRYRESRLPSTSAENQR